MKKPIPETPDSRDILTIRADDMRDNWRFVGKALAIVLEYFPVRVSHVGRETFDFEGDKTLVQIDAALDQRTVDADGKAHIVVFGALRDVLTTAHGATIQLPGAYADFPLTFTGADGDFWIDVGAERSKQVFPDYLRKTIPARYGCDKTPYVSKTVFWKMFGLAVGLLAAIDRGETLSAELVARLAREEEEKYAHRWGKNPGAARTMAEIALRIPNEIPIHRAAARPGALAAYEARRDVETSVQWGVRLHERWPPSGYLLAKDGAGEERTACVAFLTKPWRFTNRNAPNEAKASPRFRRLLSRLSRIERLAAKSPARRGLKHATIDAFMEFLQ